MKSLLLLLGLVSLTAARPALDHPNIIIVFLDDSGFADFSHTGHPSIKTPNLTRLVREGANFPQFYSASPACTASRYGLLTGRNPARSGLGKWVISPTDAKYIHPSEITLAEGLKSAGYATAIFGKWHLGTPNTANSNTPDAFPLAHGFDRWLGTNVSHDYDPGANLIEAPSTEDTPIAGYHLVTSNIAANIPVGDSLNQTYTDAAVSFIRENKDQPFAARSDPTLGKPSIQVAAALDTWHPPFSFLIGP
ncbi:MAG: sulfatase-like hydrolase/transferase [Luteolibacter sp.]